MSVIECLDCCANVELEVESYGSVDCPKLNFRVEVPSQGELIVTSPDKPAKLYFTVYVENPRKANFCLAKIKLLATLSYVDVEWSGYDFVEICDASESHCVRVEKDRWSELTSFSICQAFSEGQIDFTSMVVRVYSPGTFIVKLKAEVDVVFDRTCYSP